LAADFSFTNLFIFEKIPLPDHPEISNAISNMVKVMQEYVMMDVQLNTN
jgi:hypothetical protein